MSNKSAATSAESVSYAGEIYRALGPRGSWHETMAQGASGLSHATYDNTAYTLGCGCTYQDSQMKVYTSHPIPPSAPGLPDGSAMTQLRAVA